MAPLEVGFDEVAGEQQQQNDKPNQIEIEQEEDKRIAGCRQNGIRFLAAGNDDLGIVEAQRQTVYQKNENDPDRPKMHRLAFRLRNRTGWPERPAGSGQCRCATGDRATVLLYSGKSSCVLLD